MRAVFTIFSVGVVLGTLFIMLVFHDVTLSVYIPMIGPAIVGALLAIAWRPSGKEK